jgi:hypothetical protein
MRYITRELERSFSLSGTSSWGYWYSFFDDSRDTRCILLGRKYWRLLYNRKVFQW